MGSVLKGISSLFGGGGDNGAAEAQRKALETQERIAAQERELRIAQQNMQNNFATDLTNKAPATVVAGGTADDAAVSADLKKKKNLGAGLSSTLGLNV